MTTTFSATRYPFCGHITLSATMTSCVTSLLRWNTPFFVQLLAIESNQYIRCFRCIFFRFFFGYFFLNMELEVFLEVFFPLFFSFLGVSGFIWYTFFALRTLCCIFLLTVWKYHELTKLRNIDLIFTYFHTYISNEHLKSVPRTIKVKIYPLMSWFWQAYTTNKLFNCTASGGIHMYPSYVGNKTSHHQESPSIQEIPNREKNHNAPVTRCLAQKT